MCFIKHLQHNVKWTTSFVLVEITLISGGPYYQGLSQITLISGGPYYQGLSQITLISGGPY